jgi:hypothetical protein
LHQRAFFSFPRFQPPRASGRGVARSEDHLNAIHKYSRLRHRTADRELRTTVLMSALSFSFEYAALTPCRKSVPFGTFWESSDCGELRRNIEKSVKTSQINFTASKRNPNPNPMCAKRDSMASELALGSLLEGPNAKLV